MCEIKLKPCRFVGGKVSLNLRKLQVVRAVLRCLLQRRQRAPGGFYGRGKRLWRIGGDVNE